MSALSKIVTYDLTKIRFGDVIARFCRQWN